MTLVGKKIGSLKVVEQIGSGGMAVVYKAEQTSLGRYVAVKELRTELSGDPALITRFEREAQSIALLAHQNIVHVYDFVQRANSMYIVMEFVDGIDLYTLLKRVDKLPIDIAAIIALQAARALEYAHYHGVVHRDFKPSNLMITKAGDIKLMDFGIARDESLEDLTLPGQALGTPAYMSPEQIFGERIDFRSDLFSFGIVLYQMLTGQKPFVDDETVGVMHRIVNEPYRLPHTLRPDVPRALQRVLRRCLHKRPEKRYASTEALRIALEDFVARRVRLNPSGRLLVYLHNHDLITDDEAKTFVPPEDLNSIELVHEDAGHLNGWAVAIRPALLFNLLVAAVLSGWIFGVETLHPAANQAYLTISARGEAQLFIDGQLREAAGFNTPIAVEPGKHRVELRNERLKRRVARDVRITAGETRRLQFEFH